MTPLSDMGPAIAAIVGLLVYLLIAVGVYVWYALALSKLFPKLGAEGWKGWVPVLNDMEILVRGGVPGWSIVFAFIPFVNLYYLYLRVIAAHRIGTRFGRGAGTTVLAIVLPPLWATLLAGAQPVSGQPLEQRVAGYAPQAGGMPSVPPVPVPAGLAPVAPGAPAAPVPPGAPLPPSATGVPGPFGAFAASPAAVPPPAAPSAPPAPSAAAPLPLPPEPAAPAAGPATSVPPALVPAASAPPALVEPPLVPPVTPAVARATPASAPVAERPVPVVPPVPVVAPVPVPAAAPVPVVEPAPAVPAAEIAAPVVEPPVEPPVAPRVSPATTPAPADADDDLGETIVVDRRPRIRYLLEVEGGPRIPLTADTVVLGRKPAAGEPGTQDVAVPDTTRTLSKVHARLHRGEEGWVITDLESTNGVVVVAADGTETLLDRGASAAVEGRFILGKVAMSVAEEGARA